MNEPAQKGRSPARSLLMASVFLFAVLEIPATVVAILLLIEAETWMARLFALSVISLFVATRFFYTWLKYSKKRDSRVAGITGALALLTWLVCYLSSPTGVTAPGAKFQSVYPPGFRYARWSPVNLVPEMDQAKLGALLSPFADSIMTRKKAARLESLFVSGYRELQKAPEFVAAGSVMSGMYREMFGLPFNKRHLYVYVPEHKSGEKLPVLLFIHGSSGSFKVFAWTWKQFADDHQVAIVAPTFGLGIWSAPGGAEAIESAYEYCTNSAELDPERIVLAGLSSGGIGLSREAADHPSRYQGLVYISCLMERSVMTSPEYEQGFSAKPILVIHGQQDERIPPGYIADVLGSLPPSMQVETNFIPGEDHFLFFSAKTQVEQMVSQWMGKLK